jgi:hypothetical protein
MLIIGWLAPPWGMPQDAGMEASSKRLLWWLLPPMLLLFAVCWVGFERVSAVAAVQDSMSRNYEITFGTEDRPRILPAFIDDPVQEALGSIFEATQGAGNKDIVYGERFRSLFRGPVRKIEIWEPHNFTGDLGAALLRFPRLQRLAVNDCVDTPTEAQWTLFWSRIRSLPELEEIEFDGNNITNASIAPLSGHPRLRKITLDGYHLTAGCVKTLATLPSLTNLTIEESGNITPADRKAMVRALPSVEIEFQ